MFSPLPIALVLASMGFVAADDAPSASEEGFVPLFDGKTFQGWEDRHGPFRIKDGAIGGGDLNQPTKESEFLCTTKEFTDFELRLKFKAVPTKTEEVNGGIQFRSKRAPEGSAVIGYQADIGVIPSYAPYKFWGCIYDDSRRNRVIAGDGAANEKFVKKGDWNDYVIRCEGKRIRLWLNGHQTVDYTEPDASIPQTGIIALQLHSGPPQEVWYKDICIKVHSTGAKP